MNNKKVTKAGVSPIIPKATEFAEIQDVDTINRKEAGTILQESKEIDTKEIAREILQWTIDNVAQFIDNQRKAFKLDLMVNSEVMKETSKLQGLYLSIPYVETFQDLLDSDKARVAKEASECREALDLVTKSVFEEMKGMKEMLDLLFEKMSYYYEMVGFFNGKPLIKKLIGAVDIVNFEYENFSVGVKIASPSVKIAREDGNQRVVNGQEKEYMIPEGFSVWVEISFKDALAQKSMF